MTIQEALELLKDDELADGEEDADKFNEAYNMAIRSLEAWEKVIKEIQEHESKIPYKVYDGIHEGLEEALKIIDKHLKEVEK